LPADYRLPLVLRDVHGLEYREVAELLGRPLGTVKAMVHRGRNAVRLRLRASGSLAGER
jgi:RNA polymerase sigma-70 factor (ECF subfamily)